MQAGTVCRGRCMRRWTGLRGNPAIVPALRKRIIDLDTRITNLTVTNKRVLDELRSVAGQTP